MDEEFRNLVRDGILQRAQECDLQSSIELSLCDLGQGAVDLWIESSRSPAICVSLTEGWGLARIIVGPYAFEGVPLEDVAEFVVNILLGKYEIRIRRRFFVRSVWMFVKVGDDLWSEGRGVPRQFEWWEESHIDSISR